MITVLFVDDEPAFLEIGRMYLEKTGEFCIAPALSGKDALALLDSRHVDAIVADYQMPEMDGIALLRQVRERDAVIPFILFTGKSREEIVIEAINNGADFYLQKGGDLSVQFAELQDRIQHAVRRRNAKVASTRRTEELQAAYGQLSAADAALRENYRILLNQQVTLQGNEEKYRNLFEAESDAILLIDNATGDILEANNAASLLYGYSHDELLKKKNADLSAELEETRKVTQETPINYDKIINIPLRLHRRHDGTIFPVEITGRFFVWQGRPVHIAAIRDITDRYETEQSIKHQKERAVRHQKALVQLATTDAPTLRNALNRITETGADIFGIERVGIWFMSAQGDTLLCNDLYLRSRQVHEAGVGIHASDCPRYFTALSETRAIVAPDCRSHELTSALSQYYLIPLDIVSVLSVPIRSGKDVIGVLSFEEVGTVRNWDLEEQDVAAALADYTAIVLEQARRRLAEKDLKKSEEKYRAVVDRASDGIVIIQDGVFCFVNPKAAEVIGSAVNDIIGTPFIDLIAPAERQKVLEKYTLRLRGEAASSVYETTVIRKNNQAVDIEINAGLITYEGKPADLVFIRDISDRKRSELALRLANQKLHLLSSVTRHDILNKLTLVIGYFEMARMTDDPEKREDFHRKIDTSLKIMEDQIQFTRDYQDMGVKAPEWQDAAAVFARAVSQLETGSVRIGNDLEGLTLYADPLLFKVLYNIVDNSLRYGTKVTCITAGFTLSGNFAILAISDDGVGIPVNDKTHIFEKGFGQHTGLGLFLAREILSLTGIEIMETGFPGKGARFEIHIPAASFRVKDRNVLG
jgi:PAS domain S-box-containing protein